MEETAEQVASTHSASVTLAEDAQPGGRVGRLQPQRPVGTVAVVMLDINPKDPLKMTTPDNQQPIQALGTDRPHPTLAIRVRSGCPHRPHQHLATH